QPILRRRLPRAPLLFRPSIRRCFRPVLGSAMTGIEPQPVEHAAPLFLGLLRPFLVGQRACFVGAALRARPIGRHAPRQFQAREWIAALALLLLIATLILGEILGAVFPREILALVFRHAGTQSAGT